MQRIQSDHFRDRRRVHDGHATVRQRQGRQRVQAEVLARRVRGERDGERGNRLAGHRADGRGRRPRLAALVRRAQRATRELRRIVRRRLSVGRRVRATTVG